MGTTLSFGGLTDSIELLKLKLMRIISIAFLFIWFAVSALPTIAAVDHESICCKDCKNGYCLMEKAPRKAESKAELPCHQTKKNNCEMRSTGCGHESAIRAFWFDGILLDNNSAGALHLEKNQFAQDLFHFHDLTRIPTPPPRTLLS
jgi:hypothetical protein